MRDLKKCLNAEVLKCWVATQKWVAEPNSRH